MDEQGYNGIGRPPRFEVGYDGAHVRARKALAGQPCSHRDSTCKGRIEIAFRHDTPHEFQRISAQGFSYSPRPIDYMRLCLSHHIRYDKPSKAHQSAAQQRRRQRERVQHVG